MNLFSIFLHALQLALMVTGIVALSEALLNFPRIVRNRKLFLTLFIAGVALLMFYNYFHPNLGWLTSRW